MSQPLIKLPSMSITDGVLYYEPHFLTTEKADYYFHSLMEEIHWQQHVITVFGKEIPCPRLSAWYGDDGTIYSYSGLHLTPRPWTSSLVEVKARLMEITDVFFNSVLANLYRDGHDSMGWHSDNESELGSAPIIGSVSLGAVRRFVMQRILSC